MFRSPSASRSTLFEDSRALLLLAAITALVFWPWLFAGKTFYWGDTGLYFLPLTRFLSHNLHNGILPLWNPYLFCGTPFVGNPQACPFYPFTVFLAFFSAPLYLMLVNVVHLWLAGTGTYYFLRRGKINLDSYPAIIGAVVYMLGGFAVSKTQFPNMVQALAYVPFLLLCTDRLAERPNMSRAVAVGVVLGLQILAAHAQVSVLSFYLTAIYAVACMARQHTRPRQNIMRLLSFMVAALVVALGLSCVFWLPVWELLRVAERQNLGITEAHRFYLLPHELTNFFWPMRFGSPLSGDWSAPGNFWEKACYMGIVPCLLAVTGARSAVLGNSNMTRYARFWLSVFIISLLLSLGWQGGLFLLAYQIVPGIKLFHDPARMLLGAAIAIPVLAALGLHGVLRCLSKPHAALAATAILLLTVFDLGLFAHSIYPLQSIQNVAAMQETDLVRLLRSDKDVVQGRARIFFADPLKNRRSLLNYQTYFAADPQFLPHWSETLMPNLGMLFDLQQAGGYEPIAERSGKERVVKAEAALPFESATQRPEYSTLLAAMSVKYLITFGPHPLPSTPGLVLVAQSSWQHQGQRARIYRNTRFMPRAHWEQATANSIATSIEMQALLSPDVMQFHFRTSKYERRFVLTDSAYTGWHAYLNGRQVPVSRTADGFRRVRIPAENTDKESRLFFVYQPATFALSLFVSLSTLLLLSGLVCNRLARKLT